MPGKLFSFQKCNQDGYSFLAASVAMGSKITGGGRLDFPCSNFLCAPTGGTITIEYEFYPPVSSDPSKSDDGRGEKHTGVLKMKGQIGCMVAIAKAKDDGGGAQVSVTAYGSVSLDVFDGLVSARGTISGILTFYNFKVNPFDWSRVTIGIEIRVSVRIGYAEFHVAVTATNGGGWSVSFKIGNFFGIGNCFQSNWIRRRHWCDSYPRRRNSPMNQWCWGKSAWSTCGQYGSTPFPGCRLYTWHPMCLNDFRRRRRRRRYYSYRRRRRRR